MYRLQWSWDLKMCPYLRGVLISEGVMYRLQWSWNLKMCPYYIQVSMELGPEDVTLLEECPHFRGCYVHV